MLDYKEVKDRIVEWIRDWFEENGKGCNALVGISGGKDSSVVATLCAEALGKDRVIGVLMPNGVQSDIQDSLQLVSWLGIRHLIVPITKANESVENAIDMSGIELSNQTKINLPARLRMSTLYAVSQSMNGRVANTCNLSENYVGYATRYGDEAGDFSPLGNLTVREVKCIGRELGIPENLIEKPPADGLCGKTDEDNLGFSYEDLDTFILTGECEKAEIKEKIIDLNRKNKFKSEHIKSFILEKRVKE